MTTPIERAAEVVNHRIGSAFPGEMGMKVSAELTRAVFESIDVDELADVLRAHQLSEPNGGTSHSARCECSCGERSEVCGGTRDYARQKARQHVATAIKAHLLGGDRG